MRARTQRHASLVEGARACYPRMIATRRHLHRHPEVGLALPGTQSVVMSELERMGLRPVPGRTVGSVTAIIEGSGPGPTMVLRADMDALPLQEASGLPFSSETAGAMHACGHDLHMAMLLTAAELIKERCDQFGGRVLLMFQPGEEGLFGAQAMLDEGLLDGLDPVMSNASFALHVFTNYPSGSVWLRPGAMMAASDTIRLSVHGRGGHAASPHRSIDPTGVAAEIVLGLHAITARRVDPVEPAVVTIASMVSGTAHSIIPDRAILQGTMRALSEGTREMIKGYVRQLVEGICAAHGATPELEIEPGYPVTVNDPAFTDRVFATAASLLGSDSVHLMAAPVMAAEDFSLILERVPGALAFLGASPADDTAGGGDGLDSPMNHSDLVVFDEEAMVAGAAMYAAVALDYLAHDV